MHIISKTSDPFSPPKKLLTKEEENNHLDLDTNTSYSPGDSLSLTSINSTFIETIDTGYQWVGLWSAIGIPLAILIWIPLIKLYQASIAHSLFLAIIVIPGSILGLFLTWVDFFKWTQYPIRINRKNRTIYVFRIDGTVLCIPWSEIHFTMTSHGDTALSAVNLRGCVMDTDGEHVIESFDFGTQCESREGALRQWEFFRQYMLNGPKDLIGNVNYYMPSGKRESYFTGLERISAQYPGVFFKILLFPFSLYVSIFRFLAMRTHRIPVWPKEVEDACAIEPGDPYMKDYRNNPKDLQ